MKKIVPVFCILVASILSCSDSGESAGNISQKSLDSLNAISDSLNKAARGGAVIEPPASNLTSIQWLDSSELNMGKIKEGQNLEVTFRFKNTGTQPLIISNVRASCGCTIPETPKEPFAPGQEGVIKAAFNSTGRLGMNTKEVYVEANTEPGTNVLVFTVEVTKKPGT